MQRPVVVASDFSPHADEAFRYTRRFVGEHGALHLFHNVAWTSPENYGLTRGQLERAQEKGDLLDIIKRTLRQAAERVGLDPSDLILVHRQDRDPAPAIVGYAHEVGAGLLVVGTHGRRGFRRLMLGSVAGEVVQTASCDTLVVPLNARAPWSECPTRRMLVPVDLTEGSTLQVERAQEIAALVGAPDLELLHVAEPHPYAWLYPGVPDVAMDVEDVLQLKLAALAARSGAHVRTHHGAGAPAHAILTRAAENSADLIVIASHNPGRFNRILLGSVCERVLRAADRPVLVIRADAEVHADRAAASAAGAFTA